MNKNLLFALSLLFLFPLYFHAMEITQINFTRLNEDLAKTKIRFTPINDGLDTQLKGKISRIKFDHSSAAIVAVYTGIRKAPLRNLIKHHKFIQLISNDTLIRSHITEEFSPIVFEAIKTNNHDSFIDHGIFKVYKHKELINAIQENTTIYCNYGPGAFIYHKRELPIMDNEAKDIIINALQKDQRYQTSHTLPPSHLGDR